VKLRRDGSGRAQGWRRVHHVSSGARPGAGRHPHARPQAMADARLPEAQGPSLADLPVLFPISARRLSSVSPSAAEL
jgi:hypothetical protein